MSTIHSKLKPCGTDAAYYRHKRAGETPCRRCVLAHREQARIYNRDLWARKKAAATGQPVRSYNLRRRRTLPEIIEMFRNGQDVEEALRLHPSVVQIIHNHLRRNGLL